MKNFDEAYLQRKLTAKKQRGIHSYLHEVVKDVCEYVDETHRFGQWLGIGVRVGAGELQAKLKYIKARGIRDPKYLMTMCKKSLSNNLASRARGKK